jgi:hypothetical protein
MDGIDSMDGAQPGSDAGPVPAAFPTGAADRAREAARRLREPIISAADEGVWARPPIGTRGSVESEPANTPAPSVCTCLSCVWGDPARKLTLLARPSPEELAAQDAFIFDAVHRVLDLVPAPEVVEAEEVVDPAAVNITVDAPPAPATTDLAVVERTKRKRRLLFFRRGPRPKRVVWSKPSRKVRLR